MSRTNQRQLKLEVQICVQNLHIFDCIAVNSDITRQSRQLARARELIERFIINLRLNYSRFELQASLRH